VEPDGSQKPAQPSFTEVLEALHTDDGDEGEQTVLHNTSQLKADVVISQAVRIAGTDRSFHTLTNGTTLLVRYIPSFHNHAQAHPAQISVPLVFQQIDIEEYSDGTIPRLRLFGATEVCENWWQISMNLTPNLVLLLGWP
jgi:hypothetical protein